MASQSSSQMSISLSEGVTGPQLTVQLPTPTMSSFSERQQGFAVQDHDLLLANGPTDGDESDSLDDGSCSGEVSDYGEESLPRGADGEIQGVGEDVRQRILMAVEFYFSDDHVSKDAFMYKHIVRGKEGFVNLKLVASFRKVKNITKDWHLVCETIKDSEKLELNDGGTKVRRRNPLPPGINPVAKSVLVYNLGEKPSMASVESLFSGCGRIAKISLYWPGEQLPNDVRQERDKLNIPPADPLAVVEFSSAEEAQRAYTFAMENKLPRRSKLALIHSLVQGRKAERKRSPSSQPEEKEHRSSSDALSSAAAKSEELTRSNSAGSSSKRKRSRQRAVDDLSVERSDYSDCDLPRRSRTSSGASNRSWRDVDSLSPSASPRAGRRHTPHSSPKSQRRASPTPTRSQTDDGSPRRTPVMDGILRQPHGPHGVGFARGRGKSV